MLVKTPFFVTFPALIHHLPPAAGERLHLLSDWIIHSQFKLVLEPQNHVQTHDGVVGHSYITDSIDFWWNAIEL